jgi:sulfate transport system ATP-binding protein
VGTPEEVYFEPATPFVCEFIGRVNPVAMRRGDGGLGAGGWVPAGEPWHGHYPHATAYIRPEHLVIGAEGAPWQAQVRHVYLAGSIAHLDLDVSGVGTLEADVASEDLSRRNLAVGAQVSVTPARAVLFAGEADRWSWQAGAGV